jgi:hypothetical protein
MLGAKESGRHEPEGVEISYFANIERQLCYHITS